MKRPAFQFYHGDWRSNAKLRRCTHAERGIWMDALCLMADSDEFGVLRWPLKDLAQAIGCRVSDLTALRTKDVMKGAEKGERCKEFIYTPRHGGKDGDPVMLLPEQDGPVWYSSRMITDEYVRSIRGEGGRFGSHPKETPKAPIGKKSGTGSGTGSSSSSTSSTTGKPQEPSAGAAPAAALAPKNGKRNSTVESAPTWAAFSEAYKERYGVEPVRNASVNAQMVKFIQRIGLEESPKVAAFYLKADRGLYLSAKHPVTLLLRDAEGLRTEWATGGKGARQQYAAGVDKDGHF